MNDWVHWYEIVTKSCLFQLYVYSWNNRIFVCVSHLPGMMRIVSLMYLVELKSVMYSLLMNLIRFVWSERNLHDHQCCTAPSVGTILHNLVVQEQKTAQKYLVQLNFFKGQPNQNYSIIRSIVQNKYLKSVSRMLLLQFSILW